MSVIGILGVLNYIITILTSVLSRRKEFGIIRACLLYTSQTLSSVDKYVNSIYNKKEQKNTLTILEGREKIIEALNLLISHAQKRIALSIWEEEVKEIEEELIDVYKRQP